MRPAVADDFDRILAINQEGQPGVARLTLAELAEIFAAAPLFSVAEIDREVVGYVIAYTDADPYDGEEFSWFKHRLTPFLYIDQIAVARSARRARVGEQIYRFLEQLARERMLASLVCEVNLDPPNPVSLAFHAKHHFIEVSTLATSDGRTVSLRRKELVM